jgi:hypothetical protein
MTWTDFYLICFAVGFCFSLLSFLAGGLRWHLHLPHFSDVHAPAIHSPVGHATVPAGQGQGATADGAQTGGHGHGAHISPFNFVTLTAFLAWFGGQDIC